MAKTNTLVEIKDIHKSFGPLEVLKGVDFSVSEGEVVCLIGRSGSGKSTLLRCINLLEHADSGTIKVFGEDILHTKNVNAYRAKVGMCFQQFNLFNNMNVLKNCVTPQIKVLGRSKKEAQETAMKHLRERCGCKNDLRRPETACRDCARPLHGPEAHAVRRAHVGA